MDGPERRLLQWLRDAHAMELQAEKILSDQADRIQHYPPLRARIEEHLQETRTHARSVESCITARGETTSGVKDVGAQLLAMAQGIAGVFAGDEVIKSVLAIYTFEHMEIASYRIIIAAAKAVGDDNTAKICDEILRSESAMADWLMENVGPLTREFLAREDETFEDAKR